MPILLDILHYLAGKPSLPSPSPQSPLSYGHDDVFLSMSNDEEESTSRILESIVYRIYHWNDTSSTPKILFETIFMTLIFVAVIVKLVTMLLSKRREEFVSSKILSIETTTTKSPPPPQPIQDLQRRYLPVFVLLRLTYWLVHGTYLYPVYASKNLVIKDGSSIPMPNDIIHHIFLIGFLLSALIVPKIVQVTFNRTTIGSIKFGCILAAVMYGLGSLSVTTQDDNTKNNLWILFVGRALSCIGTSLLAILPEAWLATEIEKTGCDPYHRYFDSTILAGYSLDPIIGLIAGQFASVMANVHGPIGPYQIIPTILVCAITFITFYWENDDNEAVIEASNTTTTKKKMMMTSVHDAYYIIENDTKILFVGCIQCLVDASMYIFIMQWVPTISKAISTCYGSNTAASNNTPYGLLFCCWMTCCYIGSTLHGLFVTEWSTKWPFFRTERITTIIMMIASLSMFCGSIVLLLLVSYGNIDDDKKNDNESNELFYMLLVCFGMFQLCIGGFYIPSITYLRSKCILSSDDTSHHHLRTSIMTLFTVPYHLLLVVIIISIQSIIGGGVASSSLSSSGVLWFMVASVLLACAAVCLLKLRQTTKQEAKRNLHHTWVRAKYKWLAIARIIKLRRRHGCSSRQKKKDDA